MCEICKTVYERLKPTLEALENEFPGKSVDGMPVPRNHHVTTALRVHAHEQLVREMNEMGQEMRELNGLVASPLMGGGQKVSEGN